MTKNQQPRTTTINHNDNNINTNYINIFLNDECHNACNIRKLMAGRDSSKENYPIISKDYVGGNAEDITNAELQWFARR